LTPSWSIACAARGLTRRWAAVIAAAWLSVLLFAAITLPMKYPQELHGRIIDSGLVVGLTIPVAAMARTLDEGAPHLVKTASRALARNRASWAGGMLAATATLAAGLSALLPVPAVLMVADSLLLAAVAVLGAGLVGGDVAWVPPLVLAGVASAPGVVPLSVNVLYHHDQAGLTLLIAIVTAVTGVAVYARRGSVGPERRGRAWRVDAHVGQEHG
jgi:hypothetical protein